VSQCLIWPIVYSFASLQAPPPGPAFVAPACRHKGDLRGRCRSVSCRSYEILKLVGADRVLGPLCRLASVSRALARADLGGQDVREVSDVFRSNWFVEATQRIRYWIRAWDAHVHVVMRHMIATP